MAKLSNVEKANKEHSSEDFLRGVYIDLATEKNTPTDILKSKFDAVE